MSPPLPGYWQDYFCGELKRLGHPRHAPQIPLDWLPPKNFGLVHEIPEAGIKVTLAKRQAVLQDQPYNEEALKGAFTQLAECLSLQADEAEMRLFLHPNLSMIIIKLGLNEGASGMICTVAAKVFGVPAANVEPLGTQIASTPLSEDCS